MPSLTITDKNLSELEICAIWHETRVVASALFGRNSDRWGAERQSDEIIFHFKKPHDLRRFRNSLREARLLSLEHLRPDLPHSVRITLRDDDQLRCAIFGTFHRIAQHVVTNDYDVYVGSEFDGADVVVASFACEEDLSRYQIEVQQLLADLSH
jgi:hypothetical protein